MPVQTQYVEIDFSGTLDQKSDKVDVIAGNFANVVNCVYTKQGAIQKRPGNTLLATDISGGAPLASCRSIVGYNNELLDYASDSVYVLSGDGTQWISKDNVPEPTVTETVISSSSLNINEVQAGLGNGVRVYAYTNGPLLSQTTVDNIYVDVIDAKGNHLFNNFTINVTQTVVNPLVAIVGTTAIVMYCSAAGTTSNTIYARTLALTNPSATWSAETPIATDVAIQSFAVCDVVSLTNLFAITYATNTNGVTRVSTYNVGLLRVTSATFTETSGITPYLYSITGDQTADNLWVTYSVSDKTSFSRVSAFRLSVATLAVKTSVFTVESATIVSGNTYDLVIGLGICLYNANDAVIIATPQNFIGINPTSGTWKQNVLATAVASSNLSGPRSITYSAIRIVSKPWAISSKVYCVVQDIQDNTNFIADIWADNVTAANIPMRPVATFDAFTAFYNLLFSLFPSQIYQGFPVSTTSYEVPAVKYSSSVKDTQTLGSYLFSFNTPFLFTEANSSLISSGGVPSSFDGNRVAELGFLVRPITSNATFVPNSVGPPLVANTLPVGSYSYIAVYEWTDGQGQIYRSAPSAPVAITTTAIGAVSFFVTYNCFTTKQELTVTPDAIRVIIYRNQPAGQTTIYKRLTNTSLFTSFPNNLNNVNVASFQFIDDGSNEVFIKTSELLYTVGQLENDHPPSATMVLTHNSRVWLAGTDIPTRLWFSKSLVTGEPPNFSGLFVLDILEGGPITGIGSLDDKLIIFKQDKIFVVFGDGPNDTGAGASFSVQRISTDTGCVSPLSVVPMRDGLMFLSPIGISLLSRALQFAYIGSPVETTVTPFNGVISSAVNHPVNPWVLFTFGPDGNGDGVVVVYDYFQNKWSTWQLIDFTGGQSQAPVQSATTWQNGYTWATNSTIGTHVYAESSSFLDDTAYVSMVVETGWLKFAGMVGFQRVRKLIVLGEVMTPHNLVINLAHNYDASGYSQTITYDTSSLGWDSEQFGMTVVQQKCSSMKVQILDQENILGAMNGQGPSISGLGLRVGVKGNLFKLPNTQGG